MGNDAGGDLSFSTWVELTRHRARLTPSGEAFTFLLDGESQHVSWSYGKLDARARAIASRLRETCDPGARAMLLYPPGLEFIAAFLGCLYAGVIAVPAYPPRSAEHERALPRLAAIARDARPAIALTASARMLDVVRSAIAATLDSIHAPPCLDTETLADAGEDTSAESTDAAPDSIAFLQYTSGSTAAPKGVAISHANLLHNSAAIRDAFGHVEGKGRGMIWLPPYHDMGLIGGILQAMYVGSPVVLMSPTAFLQKPIRWLKAISTWKATTSGGPEFAYDLCMRSIPPEQRNSLDLSTWELAFTGGEPVRKATLDRFAEAFAPCGFRREALYPCYGLAEATLLVTGGRKLAGITSRPIDAEALRTNRVVPATEDCGDAVELVGCGTPALQTHVSIVDGQTSSPCAPEQVGEIWVRGPGVAQGYWQQPDETARTFAATMGDETLWMRTGDLGFVHDAQLFVAGRSKDLIIIRGRNHYPQDIEQTAGASHAALRPGNGAAFSVEAAGGERLVVMHEIERTQRDSNPDDVFLAVREAIAATHDLQPYALVLLNPGRLPRTSSGKVRRHACREAFIAATDLGELARWNAPAFDDPAPPNVARPGDPAVPELVLQGDPQALEGWLLEKLAATLVIPVSELDPAAPFARYGLDSASGVALAGEIAMDLDVDLQATLFWDYPSIRLLAGYLSEQRGWQARSDPAG